MRAATSLKKQFAVGDKHFCWLRIRTLCEVRDWDALEAMAAERKQHPAGWEPFVEQARKHGARRDVLSRLVSRMPDSAVKAEEYANLDMPREAAEVAARLRDTALFTRIAGAVSAGSPAALAVAQIKERFLGPG
ncbi:vacuolar protein sorting-associated protein 16, partial [Haematococcus lacustris]